MDKIQLLEIEIIKTLDFGAFHGKKIADDLLANQNYWQAVMIEFKWQVNRVKPVHEFWIMWKMYLLCRPGQEGRLYSLAESWDPTDIRFTGEPFFTQSMMDEIFLTDEEKVENDPKLYIALNWD